MVTCLTEIVRNHLLGDNRLSRPTAQWLHTCPFCVRAKGLLNDAGIEFEELVLNRDYTDRTLRAVSTNTTYPQVFIDGKLIGGSDELAEWLAKRAQARAA